MTDPTCVELEEYANQPDIDIELPETGPEFSDFPEEPCKNKVTKFLNNPRATLANLRKYITVDNVTIAVVLTLVLVATGLFAFSHEEDHEILDIEGVSANYTLVYDVEFASNRAVLEVLLRLQDVSSDYPKPTKVMVSVWGLTPEGEQVLLDDIWVQEALPHEETDVLLHDFYLKENPGDYNVHQMKVETNSELPLAITLKYRELSGAIRYQVVIAALILVGVYILIVFELMHRTISAMLGAFVCLGVVSVIHGRPTFETVLSWIDWETVGLLFGMMIMVGIFSETGFFEWAAIKAYKLSRGNIWHLTLILCILTGVLSAFLDNVTTILLLTPVTIRLCKVLDIDPQAIVMALVMLSNIGGTSTPIGDPPNIIIMNDPRISAHEDISFMTFTFHILPGTVLAALAVFPVLYYMHRTAYARKPHSQRNREVEVWKHALTLLPEADEEERKIKNQVRNVISTLELDIQNNPDADEKIIDIEHLEKVYVIRNWPLLISSVTVLSVVILMFFIHTLIAHLVTFTLAWIAVIGAMIHLLVSGIKEIEVILEKVELATLIFFAALFVLMHGLSILGLIDWIGEQVYTVIAAVPEGNLRLVAAIVLILWVSAIVSAFLDNIPFTTAMVPVVVSLSDSDLGLPMTPLVWALAFGTCFGGNGTLIGASANVVAVGLMEQNHTPISFVKFLKTGFPCMIVSVSTVMVYLLITHVLIPWY